MSFRPYYKLNGELSKYPVRKYPRKDRNKRIKCDKCGYHLRRIYSLVDFKQTTIGYRCVFCKVGFMDKTTGKYFYGEVK